MKDENAVGGRKCDFGSVRSCCLCLNERGALCQSKHSCYNTNATREEVNIKHWDKIEHNEQKNT